jgi:hypothetical protein
MGRVAVAATAMAAALMLSACTPPSAGTNTGTTSGTGSPADTASSATAGGDPGRADPGAEATGGDSAPDVDQVEDPATASSGTEHPADSAALPDRPELDHGTGSPLAVGTKSAGLTWPDGSPVTLDVLALNQARRLGSTQLHTDVDDRFRDEIAGAPEGYTVYPFSDAAADGSLGRVLAVAVSDELVTGDFSGTPAASRAGYVDAKGWHGGPEVVAQSYFYGSTPVWAAEDRLYWLDDGYRFSEDEEAQPWSLHSWAPGERNTTLLVSGQEEPALQAPSGGVTLNGRVYFSTYDATEPSGLPSLFSVPAGGGEPKLVAKNAGAPVGAGGSIVFERYFDDTTDDEFSYGQMPLVSSIARLSPGGGAQTLLKVARAEAVRGMKRYEASNGDGMGLVDEQGRPLESVALIAAGPDRVVLRQRTQLLVLNTEERTANRLLPLVRPTSETRLVARAAVCKSGTAILQDTAWGSDPVVFWLPGDGSALRWMGEASDRSTPACSGDVISLRATDLNLGEPGGLLVVRPSL